QQEAAILNKLFNADPGNMQARFDSLGTNFYIGMTFARQGKTMQALSRIKRSITDIEQLIPMDRNRPEYRTWLAVFHIMEGEPLMQSHRNHDALKSFETARDLYDGVVRTDQLDMDERLSTIATDTKISSTLLLLDEPDRARQIYQRAIEASSQTSNGNDPKQQAQFTLADSYAGVGDVSLYLSYKAESQRKQGLLTEACSWYKKSLHVWHTIPNPGLI